MVSIVILALLAIGFLVGIRRGFILQVVHTFGFVIAFIVAAIGYSFLSDRLVMWVPYPAPAASFSIPMLFDAKDLETAYYNAIAFVMIFAVVKIVLQLFASLLDFVASIPVLKEFNHLLGGLLCLVEVYVLTFFVLTIAAMLPVEFAQQLIQDSIVAKLMILYTPGLTQITQLLWF